MDENAELKKRITAAESKLEKLEKQMEESTRLLNTLDLKVKGLL